MKKIILAMLAGMALLAFSPLLAADTARNEAFIKEYNALKMKFDERLEAIKTRDEFEMYKIDLKGECENLLNKYDALNGDAQIDLVKAKLLLDLGKYADAERKTDAILALDSNLAKDAKLLKSKIMFARHNDMIDQKRSALKGKPARDCPADTWINSQALSMRQLQGKAVLIDFWAPRCGPCRLEIPTLVKAYRELKDKGLVVIGYTRLSGYYADDQGSKGKVEAEEENNLIKGFGERFKITYPIAIAKDSSVFSAYCVVGTPTLFFIDRNGNVADIEVGYLAADADKLLAKINALLK